MTSGPTAGVVPDPPQGAAQAMGSLWIAVTEAGGAWEPTGVLPAGVRLSADDTRDVHLFHRSLVRPPS